MPLIDAEGGAIPGIEGWFVDLLSPLDAQGAIRRGAAFFQIADEPGTSKRPVVMAFACWSHDMTEEVWQQVSLGYQAMRQPLQVSELWRDPPSRPPAVPWLAVWLMPFLITADVETVALLGDLERCLAWALMEARP